MSIRRAISGAGVSRPVECCAVLAGWWGGRCGDRGAPRDRGAGLTQLKFGAFVALLGICRPVPRSPVSPVWGWGSGLKRM